MWESHDLTAKWVILIMSRGILCLVLPTPCISQVPGSKGATYLCLGFRQCRRMRCAHGSWDEILWSSSPILAWFTCRHVCRIETISLKLIKNSTITIAAETHCILSSDILVPTCMLSCFSRVWLFATLCTEAHQALLSMGFSRQDYWSGLPCPPPWDLPDPGIEPVSLMSPALTDRLFTTSSTSEAHFSTETLINQVHIFLRKAREWNFFLHFYELPLWYQYFQTKSYSNMY